MRKICKRWSARGICDIVECGLRRGRTLIAVFRTEDSNYELGIRGMRKCTNNARRNGVL